MIEKRRVCLNLSKKILIGSVVGALLFTGGMITGNNNSALAKKATEAIRVNFANIKLVVNGKEIQTKAEPFSYNGNIYVPAATIANIFGIDQLWDDDTSSLRFESADRVTSAPQYMGMSAHLDFPYPLDYVYTLENLEDFDDYKKVINIVNKERLEIPKMEITGKLTPISRFVHVDRFYMLETNTQGSYINEYQIDKGKVSISLVFSSKIEPVKGQITYNEATGEFIEKMYGRKDKLVGVKVYQISNDKATKTEELLAQ